MTSNSTAGGPGPTATALRRLVRAVDAHTLWAFNAPRALNRAGGYRLGELDRTGELNLLRQHNQLR